MLDTQPAELTSNFSNGHDSFSPQQYAAKKREQAEAAGALIIASAGEDASREGLLRTPYRFAKAFDHLLGGYHQNLTDVVGNGVFEAEGRGLVIVENVEFYSMCEHHILPFWGTATVAYYPNRRIVGLSKIPRIIELFARRLQVQERLTEQVADALVALIDPRAVAVQVRAQHLCMMMRGVEKQNSTTLTETLRGTEKISDLERSRLTGALRLS